MNYLLRKYQWLLNALRHEKILELEMERIAFERRVMCEAAMARTDQLMESYGKGLVDGWAECNLARLYAGDFSFERRNINDGLPRG